MAHAPRPVRKNNWVNISFFVVTSLIGLVGAPLYLFHNGLAASEAALFLFYLVATPMSITVGYHRLFSHATFKTTAPIRFLLLFFGSASFEQSAMEWSAQHRQHHRYVDTDRDPYSIRKGFWYAHIGWLMFWVHETNYDFVKDLQKDPLLRHQDKHYYAWAITSGILVPLLIGALTGHLLGALILAVCLRLTLVYHVTFFINSVCHMFGRATYDTNASAKDNWFVALLTCGEGYHNFHHRFAKDYRNGVRWYQFDPSKWIIAGLGKVGLAWDLRRVSNFRILAAQLSGEKTRITNWLEQFESRAELMRLHETVKTRYEEARAKLVEWEEAAKEHKAVLQRQVAHYSEGVKASARKQLKEARRQFELAHADWKLVLRQCAAAT